MTVTILNLARTRRRRIALALGTLALLSLLGLLAALRRALAMNPQSRLYAR